MLMLILEGDGAQSLLADLSAHVRLFFRDELHPSDTTEPVDIIYFIPCSQSASNPTDILTTTAPASAEDLSSKLAPYNYLVPISDTSTLVSATISDTFSQFPEEIVC
jgi:hypothetical protein